MGWHVHPIQTARSGRPTTRGFDICSFTRDGHYLFIEMKGHIAGRSTSRSPATRCRTARTPTGAGRLNSGPARGTRVPLCTFGGPGGRPGGAVRAVGRRPVSAPDPVPAEEAQATERRRLSAAQRAQRERRDRGGVRPVCRLWRLGGQEVGIDPGHRVGWGVTRVARITFVQYAVPLRPWAIWRKPGTVSTMGIDAIAGHCGLTRCLV